MDSFTFRIVESQLGRPAPLLAIPAASQPSAPPPLPLHLTHPHHSPRTRPSPYPSLLSLAPARLSAPTPTPPTPRSQHRLPHLLKPTDPSLTSLRPTPITACALRPHPRRLATLRPAPTPRPHASSVRPRSSGPPRLPPLLPTPHQKHPQVKNDFCTIMPSISKAY